MSERFLKPTDGFGGPDPLRMFFGNKVSLDDPEIRDRYRDKLQDIAGFAEDEELGTDDIVLNASLVVGEWELEEIRARQQRLQMIQEWDIIIKQREGISIKLGKLIEEIGELLRGKRKKSRA